MITSIPTKKIQCKDCGLVQKSNQFHWRRKDSGITLDSRTCRSCRNVDVLIIREHRKNHPEPANSKCQCCGKVSKLQCDHSHTKSKSFRGYLCSKCNVGIGNLGDNLNGLMNGIKYLSVKLTDKQKTNLLNKLKSIL
jgi:hypothetical protein